MTRSATPASVAYSVGDGADDREIPHHALELRVRTRERDGERAGAAADVEDAPLLREVEHLREAGRRPLADRVHRGRERAGALRILSVGLPGVFASVDAGAIRGERLEQRRRRQEPVDLEVDEACERARAAREEVGRGVGREGEALRLVLDDEAHRAQRRQHGARAALAPFELARHRLSASSPLGAAARRSKSPRSHADGERGALAAGDVRVVDATVVEGERARRVFPRAVRRRSRAGDQVDDEDERRARRDLARGAIAVAELRRNDEQDAAAFAHELQALGPAP